MSTSQWHDIPKNLKQCQSPNVVRLFEDFSDDEGVYLVLERLAGTAVSVLAKRDAPWTEADASRVVSQVLKALEVVDKNGLIHADVVVCQLLN